MARAPVATRAFYRSIVTAKFELGNVLRLTLAGAILDKGCHASRHRDVSSAHGPLSCPRNLCLAAPELGAASVCRRTVAQRPRNAFLGTVAELTASELA